MKLLIVYLLKTITILFTLAGFIGIVGTVGASDIGNIDNIQALEQTFISLIICYIAYKTNTLKKKIEA